MVSRGSSSLIRLNSLTDIYLSSFTDVRFWKKIEFSKAIFRIKRSQNCRTMKMRGLEALQASQWVQGEALVGTQGAKPPKIFRLITSDE